jgi:GDP-L-fucose synthase
MAELIKKITGYQGNLVFDASMPDGTFRKLLDVQKIHSLGWHAEIGFEDGILSTYETQFGN